MIKVLHLAAHLGGGVGKALSGLATQAHASGAEFEHSFVCFEQPEKTQFIKQIRQCGGKVAICPDREQLAGLIDRAVRDQELRRRVDAFGSLVDVSGGVSRACDVIEARARSAGFAVGSGPAAL